MPPNLSLISIFSIHFKSFVLLLNVYRVRIHFYECMIEISTSTKHYKLLKEYFHLSSLNYLKENGLHFLICTYVLKHDYLYVPIRKFSVKIFIIIYMSILNNYTFSLSPINHYQRSICVNNTSPNYISKI